MTFERDDLDVFLDSWEPSLLLRYATLDPNIHDTFARQRLVDDSSGEGAVERTQFVTGLKSMDEQEERLRRYEFFEARQAEWSAHFRDYVLSAGVSEWKLDIFINSFVDDWVDGRGRRQDSPAMLAIKASIRDYDRICYPEYAERFVVRPVAAEIEALFAPGELASILTANEGLLQAFMPDYFDDLGNTGAGSLNELYVRRGVCMPHFPRVRIELFQLSSYSLALGPVEQFAQTWTRETRENGTPSIFSAPLPAVQRRVVAFAPFIENMSLSQLELVVAPPITPTPLRHLGDHGGIHEFSFE